MSLAYCTHCGAAYLVADNTCPHCHSSDPSRGPLSGQGVLTAMFLGLTIVACEPQPDTTETTEKPVTETPAQTPPEAAPEESAPADNVEVEKAEEAPTEDPSPADNSAPTEDPAPEAVVEAPPVKQPATYGIGTAQRPVGAKYGVPAYNRTPPASSKITFGNIQLLDNTECKREINVAVKKSASQLKYCHQKVLLNEKDVAGNIILKTTIESGRVSAVELHSNKTGSTNLEQCLKNKIQRFRFPAKCSNTILLPLFFSKNK